MFECIPEAESEIEVVTVLVARGDCVISRVAFGDTVRTEVSDSSGEEEALNE